MIASELSPGVRILVGEDEVEVGTVTLPELIEAGEPGDRSPIDAVAFVRLTIVGWPDSSVIMLDPDAVVDLAD